MKYCGNCNKGQNQRNIFCIQCGTPLGEFSDITRTKIDDNVVEFESESFETAVRCPLCEITNFGSVKFCYLCGTSIFEYKKQRIIKILKIYSPLVALFACVIFFGVGWGSYSLVKGIIKEVFPTSALPSVVSSIPTNQATATQTPSIYKTNTLTPAKTKYIQPSLVPTVENLEEPQGHIVFSCNDDEGFAQICMINADGSNEQRVITFPKAASTYPFLTPDGRSIIFTSNMSVDHAIYNFNLSSKQITKLTEPGGDKAFPQLSPNGNWISFADVKNNTTNIYIMNSDGTNIREIYRGGNRAVWSSDSERLAFICLDENDKPQICIMNANGTNLLKVTDLAYVNEWVSWSPNNWELVFAVGNKEEKNRKICKINADGTGYTILYEHDNSITPSYSPDGNWIVFLNYLDKTKNGGGEIYIMRKNGSDVRRLTYNDRNDWLPFWGN